MAAAPAKMGAGSNRTISRSKIRKTTARRKKRREKGSRADPLGSKPHSNGEAFSRSWTIRREVTQAIIMSRAVMALASSALKRSRDIDTGC